MENVTPVFQIDQLTAMRMGVDYHHQIGIREFKIMVRPVTIGETIEIAQTVSERFEKLPISGRNSLTEHTFLAQETLKRAAKARPDSKEEPLISDYIMKNMTPDELSYLHKQYVSVMDKANPSLESMKVEDLRLLVQELKKNPSQAIELSFLELVNVVQYLVTKENSPQEE